MISLKLEMIEGLKNKNLVANILSHDYWQRKFIQTKCNNNKKQATNQQMFTV